MSNLYLRTVDIQDFRTFGHFRVEIPPGPGLTLLVGTNGMGKSSFFDAVEWGLTGRVQRFRRYLPNANDAEYLTRRGAKGPHGVILGFDDTTALTRKGTLAPTPTAVVDLLKRPNWTAQIHDISTYLAFTHFLGQAEPQRFTSRDRNEQWLALKGPSGIERLEEVRRGLRGRSTQLAFTRRIKKDADTVAELRRQLNEWKALRTQLVRLRNTLAAAGGIDKRELEARVIAFDAEIARLGPDGLSGSGKSTVGAALVRLRTQLDAIRQNMVARRRILEGLSDIPRRYAEQVRAASSADVPLQEARAKVEAEQAAAVAADDAVTRARSALDISVATVTRIRGEVAALEAVRIDVEALLASSHEAAQIAAQLSDLNTTLVAAREELALVEARLVEGQKQTEEAARLSAAATAATQLAELARGIPGLADRARRSAEVAATLEARAVIARRERETLATARKRLEDERRAAQAMVSVARERATAIAAAVAQIASHLHDHETDCPVCRSHFPMGALQRLASESATMQSGELARAELSDARLVDSLAENARAIADADALISTVVDVKRTAEADATTLRQQEERVRAILGAGAGDVVEEARSVEVRASKAFADASAALSEGASDLAQAGLRRDSLLTQIATLERRRAELVGTARASDANRRPLLERIASAGHSRTRLEDIVARVNSRRSELAAAESVWREAERAAQEAHARALSVRSQLNSSIQAVGELDAARISATEAAASLEGRWRDAGLDGVPRATELETALTLLAQRAATIDGLQEEHARLVVGSDLANHSEELQALVGTMESIGGKGAADSPKLHQAVLVKELKEAQEALRLSRQTRTAVRALSEKLRDEADSFSTQFLAPLNDLIGKFNEALLSTPSDSVRFQTNSRVDITHFEMGLQYRDPLDDALFNKDLPPQVVLSEGQLAANGFSILCAASTAYPWSRWRSLLLDDPLQHNDIIHSAAFVDLMCNLVELERYQLLMSSHDRAEAEFIARKFEAADLPCKVISLTAPSKAGVRYEEPTPNAAAQALLRRPLAVSA